MGYSEFLTAHAGRISSIESSLRSLTWFLPGRSQDAELASEALYSALNVLGLYHDRVLIKASNTLPRHLKPQPSSHYRYTAAWCDRNAVYRLPAIVLSILSRTELMIEMVAKRRLGSDNRWRVILFLECLKAVLKLQIVGTTGRSFIYPPLPEREIHPGTLDGSLRPSPLASAAHSPFEGDGYTPSVENSQLDHWKGPRTGLERPTIASLRARAKNPVINGFQSTSSGDGRSEVNDYLLSKILTVEQVRKPEDLVSRLDSRKIAVAELVWIFRPVIYVLAMRRYGSRHTAPFLLSLTLEYLARSLRQSGPSATLPLRCSDVEYREMARRQSAFWWYFLRGPVWDGWTRPQLETLANLLEGKPLLGLISTVLKDYTPLIDSYFYYSN